MQNHVLQIGRTFGVRLDPGEDFFTSLDAFFRDVGLKQGYIPTFVAAFSEAEVVGSCEKLQDPHAPVWSKVHLTNAEAVGGGTLAWDPRSARVLPHIHTSIGLKEHSATGFTSHLLSATIQFIAEIIVVEVTSPVMGRPSDADLYDVPRLTFGAYSL